MRQGSSAPLRLTTIGLVLALSGCAHRHVTPASRPGTSALRTGADKLEPGWERVKIPGAEVALHHPGGGALAASWACDQKDEGAPLDVLTNHLLFELRDRKERGRDPVTIDGHPALRTRMSATLDGVPVELALVVYKKDGCVVDAQLVSPPADVALGEAAFARFIDGLAFERRRP